MKLYWLPLLILGAHFSALTPKAAAFEFEAVPKTPTEIINTSTNNVDKLADLEGGESPWVKTEDTSISLEKGFHRRRFGRSRFRPNRFRGDIFFRNGSIHRIHFRHGEFRRDEIFFRNRDFRHGSVRHHNFYRGRFRHGGRHDFHHDRFRHDRFRHHDFYRIRIH
ncbi:hypothetical protein Lepto7375DRAFT_5888 [Leptolyngbya sp. PCC 7375]|nr:hypothetical protein Lepto7375DRAFT_5888 [Leptolyngbya sp. PCC 7375]